MRLYLPKSFFACTLICVLSACIRPPTIIPPTATSTATPTITSTSTPTHTITPTPIPTITVANWQLIFSDEFDYNKNGWTRSGSSQDLSWQTAVSNGKFDVELTAKKDNVWYPFTPLMENLQDFYFAADVRMITPPQDNAAALIFRRVDGEHYYTFETKEPNLFRSRLFGPSGRTELIPWEEDSLLATDKVNHFAVLGIGAKFQFYINGICVAKIEDSQLTNGIIGILGRLSKANDVLSLEIDNIEVRLPTDFGNVQCP